MSLVKFKPTQVKAVRTSPPPKAKALVSTSSDPVDTFRPTSTEAPNKTYSPSWAAARSNENKAKMSGFQIAALALGTVAALGGMIGAVVSTAPSSAPVVESVEAQAETETTQEVDLAVEVAETQAVQEEAPQFSDGRELLIDRSDLVHAQQYQPDPGQAISQRGKFTTYAESYIQSLVDRNVTEVPEGAPSFTAHGVDSGQSSKIYHDAELNEVGFGYGSVKSGEFFTRKSNMNRGNGLRDEIIQHQLSAVYRLEAPATMDGVRLDPGLYRVVALSPSSRIATPSMHRAVAPGHRLVPTGSGFANDYKPVQTSETGEALRVNPDDIVQVWSLTEAEQAQFQQ